MASGRAALENAIESISMTVSITVVHSTTAVDHWMSQSPSIPHGLVQRGTLNTKFSIVCWV